MVGRAMEEIKQGDVTAPCARDTCAVVRESL